MAKTDSRRQADDGGVIREATSLLLLGASLFLFLSLGWSQATGAVGRLLASPLRISLGAFAYLVPSVALMLALNMLRSRPGPSRAQWSALVGALLTGAILVELAGIGPGRQLGGVFGEFLSTVLRANFGEVGSYCVLLPVFVFSVLVVTRTPLGEVMSRAAGLWSAAVGTFGRVSDLRNFFRAPSPVVVSDEPRRPARASRAAAGRENVRKPREEGAAPPIVISERPQPERNLPVNRKPMQESFRFGDKYQLPPLANLEEGHHLAIPIDEDSLRASSLILSKKLADFGVQGKVTAVRPGPVITTFEFEPAPGVKVNRIVALADDLSMALRAMSVRILAPIPGKSVVGIEVSNPKREKVTLRDILESEEYQGMTRHLPLALGKDSVGKPVVADLARMPHLLVAGATGTGKSVSLNAMIMSILFKASPEDVRFLMIDPKMLELSLYENLPHQLTRVIIDPREASAALTRAVVEMEDRYRLLRDKGVRNIDTYNRVLDAEQKERDKGLVELKESQLADEGFKGEAASGRPQTKIVHRHLPYLLVIIDELADLMIASGREIEEQVTRLAQKARAAGIHLILATQRPSVDVITGLIKANFPARISFQVTSRVDSRTILDAIGAERLLGDGDMLFLSPGTARLTRIHGAYVSENEIRKCVSFIKSQSRPVFDADFTRALDEAQEDRPGADGVENELADDLYEQAVELVRDSQQASISWVQRRLRVGYNRAARMIERMEREGIVTPQDGVRGREVRPRRDEEPV